jgi:hypothetical protein
MPTIAIHPTNTTPDWALDTAQELWHQLASSYRPFSLAGTIGAGDGRFRAQAIWDDTNRGGLALTCNLAGRWYTVRITLNGCDLYDLEVSRPAIVAGQETKTLYQAADLHADMMLATMWDLAAWGPKQTAAQP